MSRFFAMLMLAMLPVSMAFLPALPITGSRLSTSPHITHKAVCSILSMKMSTAPSPERFDRRELANLALRVAGMGVFLPSVAGAFTRGDGAWTKHNGPFLDKEIGEGFKVTESGLQYKDVVVGKGECPKDGQAVLADYTGYTLTGEMWASTYDEDPRSIRAGAKPGQKFMAGLNEALLTMKPGGRRIVVLPPNLAYNYLGIKSDKNPAVDIIPPYSVLVCYIEMLEVRDMPASK